MIQGQSLKSLSLELMLKSFPIDKMACELTPNMDITPTREIYAIVRHKGENWLDKFHWGLVPSWAEDISLGNRMINARAETIAEKPSFREAFRMRRCLIPADGFYEWHDDGGKKQPVLITLPDRKPFAFAGLWETWQGTAGQTTVYKSCTIVTTRAVEAFRPFHHRMPVILKPDVYEYWLDSKNQKVAELVRILKSEMVTKLVGYPVSRFGKSDDPANIADNPTDGKPRQTMFVWPKPND